MDTSGKWSEHPAKLLTFDSALDALSYISARKLTDARVCVCHDRGCKTVAPGKRAKDAASGTRTLDGKE
jgi:hypothetical protein